MSSDRSATAAKATLTTPSDREIVTERVFQAPRERVWAAFTEPDLISRWWGLRSSVTIIDRQDLRAGGGWRFVQRNEDGSETAFRGDLPRGHPARANRLHLRIGGHARPRPDRHGLLRGSRRPHEGDRPLALPHDRGARRHDRRRHGAAASTRATASSTSCWRSSRRPDRDPAAGSPLRRARRRVPGPRRPRRRPSSTSRSPRSAAPRGGSGRAPWGRGRGPGPTSWGRCSTGMSSSRPTTFSASGCCRSRFRWQSGQGVTRQSASASTASPRWRPACLSEASLFIVMIGKPQHLRMPGVVDHGAAERLDHLVQVVVARVLGVDPEALARAHDVTAVEGADPEVRQRTAHFRAQLVQADLLDQQPQEVLVGEALLVAEALRRRAWS